MIAGLQHEPNEGKKKEKGTEPVRSRLYENELEKKKAFTKKLEDSKLDIKFGSQIRSYVMQPYRMVKDLRTRVESGDVDRVLDGDLAPFIRGYLLMKRKGEVPVTGADEDLD